jgi:hypothetical protein
LHGKHTPTYFGTLYPAHAETQLLFWDRNLERLVARGRTLPFRWDGTLKGLPPGMNALGLRAVEERARPNAISALAAEVVLDQHGRGLSKFILQGMAAAARAAGLAPLVAPVRPSLKERYPLISIELRALDSSRRAALRPMDEGACPTRRKVTAASPRREVKASVSVWERWVEMEIPADGDYIFPRGLAPLVVSDGSGLYFEPNVWMLHDI